MEVGDQAEVLVDDQDVPQPVNGALLGVGEYHAAVERPGAGDGRTEARDADGGGRWPGTRCRCSVPWSVPVPVCERVGCRDRSWDWPRQPRPRRRSAWLVRWGAVEPVDRHAPVGFGPGGVGMQPGVSARRAHQRRLKQGNRSPLTHEIAGVNDVNSVGLSEAVVGMNARAGGAFVPLVMNRRRKESPGPRSADQRVVA